MHVKSVKRDTYLMGRHAGCVLMEQESVLFVIVQRMQKQSFIDFGNMHCLLYVDQVVHAVLAEI